MVQAEAQFAFTRAHLAGRLVFYEMAFMSDKNTAPIFLVQADSCSFGKDVLEVIARVARVDCTLSYMQINWKKLLATAVRYISAAL